MEFFFFIAILCGSLLLCCEFGAAATIGLNFISYQTQYLTQELESSAKLNPWDHSIMMLTERSPLRVKTLFCSNWSVLSRYYMETQRGDIRILRFSKADRVIKQKFKELKEPYKIK